MFSCIYHPLFQNKNVTKSEFFILSKTQQPAKYRFYARKQLLLSARLSHRNSVCPSVRPSFRHTGESVKNVAS